MYQRSPESLASILLAGQLSPRPKPRHQPLSPQTRHNPPAGDRRAVEVVETAVPVAIHHAASQVAVRNFTESDSRNQLLASYFERLTLPTPFNLDNSISIDKTAPTLGETNRKFQRQILRTRGAADVNRHDRLRSSTQVFRKFGDLFGGIINGRQIWVAAIYRQLISLNDAMIQGWIPIPNSVPFRDEFFQILANSRMRRHNNNGFQRKSPFDLD